MNRKERRRLARQAAAGPPARAELEERFAQASGRHQTGDVEGAARLYREILAIDAGHAESLRMLGAIAVQSGRFETAIDLFQRALRTAPRSAPTLFLLGAAFHEAGRDVEALAAFERALELRPQDPIGQATRADILFGLGRLEQAVVGYRRALALRPRHAPALSKLGDVLSTLGRKAEALEAYQSAAAIEPGHVHARRRAGALHLEAERHDKAASEFRAVIALVPDDHRAHVDLGTALRRLGDPAAVDVLRRAEALRPGDLESGASLANALQEHGCAEEALQVSTRLLEQHPASAYAWSIRAALKTFAGGDPDIHRMEGLLTRIAGAMTGEDSEAEILAFALGKAWMDVGDPDSAFAHLARANRLRRAQFDYDGRAEVEGLASVPDGVETLARLSVGQGIADDRLVFVVGMPRSGTTLVEQILASHAEIHGAGELTAFPEAMRDVLEDAGLSTRGGRRGSIRVHAQSRFEPAKLARAYLDRVGPFAAGKRRLVDKLPGNFANVGLIALALPAARIIHCVRDPVDTCLSCYATRFVQEQPFAYDLAELGQFYRAYAALMDHWRAKLPPERFLEVRYEDVLTDIEAEARRLTAFLGLDWDTACLEFHQTRRPVRTASLNQVRRPLYRSSRGRWRAYAPHLRPLIEALGPLAPSE